MKPFNFNEGSREQTRREAVARARFHRWQVPGRSKVVHPAHGAIVVPPRLQPGRDPERGGGVAVRLGDNPGRRGVGRRSGGAGGQNAYTY